MSVKINGCLLIGKLITPNSWPILVDPVPNLISFHRGSRWDRGVIFS
jgi:hypothetical protein